MWTFASLKERPLSLKCRLRVVFSSSAGSPVLCRVFCKLVVWLLLYKGLSTPAVFILRLAVFVWRCFWAWKQVCKVVNLCVVFQRAANMIPAHDSPLAALAFDATGTKLATASEKVVQLLCGTLPCHLRSWFCFPHEEMRILILASCNSVATLYIFCAFFHFLSGYSHPCLLDPRGTEALRVSTRSQEVDGSCTAVLILRNICARFCTCLPSPLCTCVAVLVSSGALASVRWRSVWTACTFLPPATQRRSTSSN